MNYNDALNYISNTQKFGNKLGLERIRLLMDYLDNPQRKLNIIHLAGTNGKGSTSSYISTILSKAGYRVGLFTSPSLDSFNERIMINNEPIENEDLARVTKIVKNKVDEMVQNEVEHPTEFEIVTAIALVYFLEKKVDFVVLEVGLGGRYDSTNVIDKSIASVITPIAMDHMNILGDTIEKIALEKAGIIKKGGLVISYPQVQGAQRVVEHIAKENGAELIRVPIDSIVVKESGTQGNLFDYRYKEDSLKDLKIDLLGEHQIYNACLALTTVLTLRNKGIISISEDSIRQGLRETMWKGRLEILRSHPIHIIDGAHNLHGAKALRKSMGTIFMNKRIIMVISILEDKDVSGILNELAPIAHKIVATESDNSRVMKAEKLAEFIGQFRECAVEPDIKEAIKKARSLAEPEDIILFCGSLYMIKDVRKEIVNN